MRKVGITQRVERVESYGETRDALDEKWSELLLELDFIPIPLPNIAPRSVSLLLDALNLDAIIFSGGNSLGILDESASDVAPQRDAFEAKLLSEALKRGINILGVCRGMQMINSQMGGTLSMVKGHIATKHPIFSQNSKYHFTKSVNSYHSWGISKEQLSDKLELLALDEESYVEAFACEDRHILGIMWHPERETPFDKDDKQLLKRFL